MDTGPTLTEAMGLYPEVEAYLDRDTPLGPGLRRVLGDEHTDLEAANACICIVRVLASAYYQLMREETAP